MGHKEHGEPLKHVKPIEVGRASAEAVMRTAYGIPQRGHKTHLCPRVYLAKVCVKPRSRLGSLRGAEGPRSDATPVPRKPPSKGLTGDSWGEGVGMFTTRGGLILGPVSVTKCDEVCGIHGCPGPTKVWMEMTCTPKGQESGGPGALVVVAWGMGSPRHCWGGHLGALDVFRAWLQWPPPATRALKGSGSSLQKGPGMLRSGSNSKWVGWDTLVSVPTGLHWGWLTSWEARMAPSSGQRLWGLVSPPATKGAVQLAGRRG